MSNVKIKVSFLAGTDIKEAIKEAKKKAIKWGVAYVEFNFNDWKFCISQKCSTSEAIKKWKDSKITGDKYIVE